MALIYPRKTVAAVKKQKNENIIAFKDSSPKSHACSNKSHFAYFIIIAIRSKALEREIFHVCFENRGAFVQ